MSKEEEFLREYEKLCQKYMMGIGSCGCCSSPFLEVEGKKTIYDINYHKDTNSVTIDHNFDSETYDYVSYSIDKYFTDIRKNDEEV